MKIIDILTSPWAIQPEKYQEIVGIYRRRVQGEHIDIGKIEAEIGRPLKNEQKRYEVIDGVAVIPVEGVLGKRMNMFMQISGGSSTQIIANDFRAALDDQAAKAVMLLIDSPGGTVDGTQDLASLIYESRGIKPVYSLADGLMASAAAWIGTAAERVYLTNETVHAGSIGVVTAHEDWSKHEEKQGIKTTEIYAGKYKRIVSEFKPLSEEGAKYLQDMVDYIYSVFVNDVARNRGADPEMVLKNMADGRLFIGSQAVKAGLVDGIRTFEEVVAELKARAAGTSDGGWADQDIYMHYNSDGEQADDTTTTGGSIMNEKEVKTIEASSITAEYIESNFPEVAAKIKTAAYQKGKTEGAEAERQRIQDVEAQSMPGHEALIAALKYDGKTTGPEAAVQVLAAEKANNARTLRTLETEAPKPAEASMPEKVVVITGDSEADTEAALKAKWDGDPKLRQEFIGADGKPSFESYQAFMMAERSGRVHLLNKIEDMRK